MFGRPSLHDYYLRTINSDSDFGNGEINISTDGSCSNINNYHNWTDKCYFAQHNSECSDVDGFINYIYILYCHMGQTLFPLTIIIFIIWLLVLFIALAVSADDYFCPAIEIISKTLRLSQNIAGVTIMALGNGAPDIFSCLAGIGQDRPDLVFGELFGAGVFVTTVVAGSVAITQPFKSMERPFLRDVTFYLIAGFWAFCVFWRQEIRLFDSLGLLVLYLVYLVVVVVGRYINNNIKRDRTYITQVNEVEEEPQPQEESSPVAALVGDPPEVQLVSVYNNINSNNIGVGDNLNRLLRAVNPIDFEQWKETGWCWRLYQILKAPVDLVFRLTIPVVDKEKPLDNWCQFLAILHSIMGPMFSVFAVAVALEPVSTSSGFKVWNITLLLSLALALLVSITSQGSSPPVYHVVFAFSGFIISIVWIYVIANELVSLLKAVGVMFGLTDAILGLTVLAWGNSIGDLVADTAMARRGSPRTGFSACFGGPLFNLLLGIGLPFSYQIIFSKNGSSIPLEFDMMTLALSVGLGVSLVFSLIILPLTKFRVGKIYGFILIGIYIIFLGTCIALEFTILDK